MTREEIAGVIADMITTGAAKEDILKMVERSIEIIDQEKEEKDDN